MNVESTHHFASDPLTSASVVRNIASPSLLSQVPQPLVTRRVSQAGVKGVASGITDIGPPPYPPLPRPPTTSSSDPCLCPQPGRHPAHEPPHPVPAVPRLSPRPQDPLRRFLRHH